MNKKVLFSFLGALALIATAQFSFSQKAEKKITEGEKIKVKWILAHEPISVFEEAVAFFANELAKETNGAMEVEIIKAPANKPKGFYQELFGQLKSGEVQMTQTYTTSLGKYAPELRVLDLPYLFRDHEHAAKVLDGNIGQDVMKGLLAHNMRGLGFTYSGGYRIIPSKSKEITKMEDFEGLVVRTSSSPVTNDVLKTLGAKPRRLPIHASAEKMEKGHIDALELTYVRVDEAIEKNSKVVNDTGHSLFLTGLVVNEKFFQSLPPKFQEAMKKAALKTAQMERDKSIADGEARRQELIKNGVKVVTLSSKEKTRIKAAMKGVYKRAGDDFGHDLIAKIEAVK